MSVRCYRLLDNEEAAGFLLLCRDKKLTPHQIDALVFDVHASPEVFDELNKQLALLRDVLTLRMRQQRTSRLP
jgi:hypothetical protein